MSSDYVSAIAKGQSAIVVSPTHAEGHRITSEIRDRLRFKKVLGKEEKHFTIFETAGLTEAERGDRVNYGSIYTIKRFTPDGGIVLAENGWTIAHDFGHLAYGYVVTSHASQGKSVDQVFIGQSSESFRASSREQFYVSVSRGSKKATIYTDDKHALRQQITESDERLSATEFVDGNRRASAIARLNAQENSLQQSQESQKQVYRELVYER